ncbi:hypothetical protein UFOVP189_41 [uncultured Caudovirales phage]|uniref:Uncharacterized protein n=1 Tax=uncultured Caudovirales phage TaxID=2100421 RepID=A0A6J7WF67_9CAUD|nr:hypothetical protein UFOVP189_41 [uncultured Caudovirales phage]
MGVDSMTGFNSKQQMAADKVQEPEREALKLALEALEESKTYNDSMEFHDRKNKAITAVKEALAQPVQEPTGMLHIERLDKWLDASLKERKQRSWIGLTDADFCREINTADFLAGAFFAEAKLKERNHGT